MYLYFVFITVYIHQIITEYFFGLSTEPENGAINNNLKTTMGQEMKMIEGDNTKNMRDINH